MEPLILLHKYWKTASMSAVSPMSDKPWMLLWGYLLRFLRVAILLSLWRTILRDAGVTSGMTLESVLTYTLMAAVFEEQLVCRTGLENDLWSGAVATRFQRPMGIVGQLTWEMIGGWGLNLCLFSVPLFLISPLLDVNALPSGPAVAGWFGISLVLTIAVGLAMDIAFASLVVFFEQSVYAITQIRNAVSTLLSGALLPLALFPWGIGEVFSWLPFASMASAPLRIYTGTGDASKLIGIQAGWCLILWPLALWLWRTNRERMVSHGG